MRDPKSYAKKVETYVERYATPEDADRARGGDDEDDDEDDDDEVMGGGGQSSRPKAPTRGVAPPLTAPPTNGHSSSNGTTTNGHSTSNGTAKRETGSEGEEENDDDDDEDDKMSDMGELSDGDGIMGEMDD